MKNFIQTAINTNAPCHECQSTAENWMCLSCNRVLCGRYISEHMMMHNQETSHPMAISFSDLSVWCYACEAYVDNKKLYVYKNMAHWDKFGYNMPWSYGDGDPNESSDDGDDSTNPRPTYTLCIQRADDQPSGEVN